MSTITVNQFNDDGTTARAVGEVLTVNGGTITFRTDTRTSAGVNNTLGGNSVISATLGGGIVVDGRNVRWLPITGGSGATAIGATVSQGGVSGIFLGYWASLTARGSTTVGATGWIKLREVTGGAFAAGALTGIAATAGGPDVTGWLEIIADQAANFNIPRLGNFTVRGDWFYLDDTTGAAGQILQVPTNGGGVGTECPGCWIETAPASGVYDFYPALKTTAGFVTANLGTDERCKFVQNMTTGGQMRIGNDGTTAMGFVPPAGCKTRVPNVFFRQCTTAARQTNAVPHATIATRPDFTTTSAGAIDIEYMYGDWYLIFAQPYSVKLHHTASFDSINVSECATGLDLLDGGVGMSGGAAGLDINALVLTSNFAGGTITDWRGERGNAAGSNDHSISLQYCIGQTFTRVQGGILAFARSSGHPIYANQCSDLTFNECRTMNGPLTLNTSFGCVVNNKDHVDRYKGTTNTTSGTYAVLVQNSCDNIKIDGMTFGLQGAIANCHPYAALVYAAASSNIKIRNLGTRTAPLSGGSANQPAYIFNDAGNNVGVQIQRCYMAPTRTRAILSLNSTKNLLVEHVYGDFADGDTCAALNMTVRGCGLTTGVAGQASVYGTHWVDAYSSTTVGRIVALMNEATTETASLNVLTAGAGSGFTSAGGLSLANLADEYITEMPYSALGHLTLSATTPVVTGTNVTYSTGARWGNHDIFYQVDTGAGYGGTWLNLTNNLSQTINAAGTKFKFRIVCAVANATNLVSFIRLNSTTSTAAMDANMYPLSVNTVTFTGLPLGYDAVVLTAGTSTVLSQSDSVASTTYAYTYEGTPTVDVGFIKTGYVPFYIRNLALTSTDSSIPVSLTVDRNYA